MAVIPSPMRNGIEAWKISAVDDNQWAEIRDGLRHETGRWLNVLKAPREVTGIEFSGLVASIAHLAYHLGADPADRKVGAGTEGRHVLSAEYPTRRAAGSEIGPGRCSGRGRASRSPTGRRRSRTRPRAQIVGDVLAPDRVDRVDDDVAVIHRVAAADLDMRLLPDADAASDPSALDPVAKLLGEDHNGVRRKGREGPALLRPWCSRSSRSSVRRSDRRGRRRGRGSSLLPYASPCSAARPSRCGRPCG